MDAANNWRKPISWRELPPKIINPTLLRDARIARYNDSMKIEIESLDNFLKFKQEYKGSYVLPEPGEIYNSPEYEFDEFQIIREEMRALKIAIYEEALQDDWKQICDQFNLSIAIKKYLKKNNFEMFPLASLKMYEIFESYPIVRSGKLNSAHIVDSSGFSLPSLNHFLQTNFTDVEWNWKAITYNPYYEDTISTSK